MAILTCFERNFDILLDLAACMIQIHNRAAGFWFA